MGFTAVVTISKDRFHAIRNNPEAFVDALASALGGTIATGDHKSISLGGGHVASVIDIHDSDEASLILCRGSKATCLGRTDARSQGGWRGDKVMMKDILRPYDFNVVDIPSK